MARLNLRLAENAPGELFVDSTCIDCDTCRQLAPAIFAEGRGTSYVRRQPAGEAERLRALMALVACPTASIGAPWKAAEAARAFPERIDGPVHYCGYASEQSFGASSYLIERPAGNVLVDSPRAAGPLLSRLAALGGVRFMFLTHRDDVADHAAFRERFGCERVLHEADVSASTRGVELQRGGAEPWPLGPGLTVIPVPGHTRGSSALLVEERYLFTGDHLWADDDGALAMSRGVCWYSWEEQRRSLRKLLDFRFEWVLPGHGRRLHLPAARMRRAVERLVD
jgi:glyoxylase-like metal-dependent hydrolase (beta-lactamase superfamily II)/ferredoxin